MARAGTNTLVPPSVYLLEHLKHENMDGIRVA